MLKSLWMENIIESQKKQVLCPELDDLLLHP